MPSFTRSWAVVGGSSVVAAALCLWGMRIDRADLTAPFAYDQDALLILPMVHGTLEFGHHWTNPRLGAPGIQRLHDYPVVDHLHFGLIRLIGLIEADRFRAFNSYYLLTYPLAAGFATAAFRRLNLSDAAAFAGGVLYAFLPYHWLRGENHYFLSAYFLVPPAVRLGLEFIAGPNPYYRAGADGRPRFAPFSGPSVTTTVLLVAVSAAGAYYAFFTCVVFAIAALAARAASGRWHGTVAAGLAIGTLVVAGVANHAPSILDRAAHGENRGPALRLADEADLFGIKLLHLVLPHGDHRLGAFRNAGIAYHAEGRPSETENGMACLGAVGAVGAVAGLLIAVLPVRVSPLTRAAATLLVGLVLVCTIGGGGSLFNAFVSPQVRAYNRASVFLGFLALWFTMRGLDAVLSSWGRATRVAALLAITGLGVLDQTPRGWFRSGSGPSYGDVAARSNADRDYFRAMEAALPPGTAVYCLPYIEYPEPYDPGRPMTYRQACGYLHTSTLRWNYGAMKHRAADVWQRTISRDDVPTQLARLVFNGFDAVSIDVPALAPGHADAFAKALANAPGGRHANGRLRWYDLRPHRERLRRDLGEDGYRRAEARELAALTVEWCGGFYCHSPEGAERTKWGLRDQGDVTFLNPTDGPRRVGVSFLVASAVECVLDVKLTSSTVLDGETESPYVARHVAGPKPVPFAATWVVPPGLSMVHIRVRPTGPMKPNPPFFDRATITDVRFTDDVVPVRN